MTQSLSNILQLLKNGENIFVEYKESKTELNKDVYQTVCIFSNRAGDIFLGGKDETIVNALPHHKTDLILRKINLDRYDDREIAY